MVKKIKYNYRRTEINIWQHYHIQSPIIFYGELKHIYVGHR